MKQTIDHSDCLVTYFGDCIHSVQKLPDAYNLCKAVEGCTKKVYVDDMNEKVCEAGHSQDKPAIEEQYWKESQV